MSILFPRDHAAPPCTLQGTGTCPALLSEGGEGSLCLFSTLLSGPAACEPPPRGDGGRVDLAASVSPPPAVLWLLLCPPGLRACERCVCSWVDRYKNDGTSHHKPEAQPGAQRPDPACRSRGPGHRGGRERTCGWTTTLSARTQWTGHCCSSAARVNSCSASRHCREMMAGH